MEMGFGGESDGEEGGEEEEVVVELLDWRRRKGMEGRR